MRQSSLRAELCPENDLVFFQLFVQVQVQFLLLFFFVQVQFSLRYFLVPVQFSLLLLLAQLRSHCMGCNMFRPQTGNHLEVDVFRD